MLPPTSLEAGGVGGTAGEPFKGLPAGKLDFTGCCEGSGELQELQDSAPPAIDEAGGA